jgi:hypothetical protein
MERFKRKPAIIISLVTLVLLILSSGMAQGAVHEVSILTVSRLSEPAPPAGTPLYVKAGDTVEVTGWTRVDSGEQFNLHVWIGNAQPQWEMTGAGTDVEQPFSVQVTIAADQAEGLVDVMVLASITGGSGESSLLNNAIVVDNTPPDPLTNIENRWGDHNSLYPGWTWDSAIDPPIAGGLEGSGVDHLEVRYSVNSGAWSLPINVDGAAIGLSFTSYYVLPDGRYHVELVAVDKAGNRSVPVVSPDPYLFDTTPPTVPGAPQPSKSPANEPVAWTWHPSRSDDGYPVSGYLVYLDGTYIATVTGPEFGLDDYSEAALETLMVEGVHQLEVAALDSVGNASELSAPGYVTIDRTPPESPVAEPLPRYTKEDSVTLRWSGVADAVMYELAGIKEGDGDDVVTTTATSYVYDISGIETGNGFQALVRAIDAAGNVSGWSQPMVTSVDREPPTVRWYENPGIDPDDDPPGSQVTTTDPRPKWMWVGEDSNSLVDYYVYYLDNEPRVETNTAYYQAASDLSDGKHTLTVYAYDNAGNVSQALKSEIYIDTTPPPVPGIPRLHASEKNPTNNTRPFWEWDPSPGAAFYGVYLDGRLVCYNHDTVIGDGLYVAVGSDFSLSEGSHYLQVTACDGAGDDGVPPSEVGNESALSAPGWVEIDLTPPDTPLLEPLPEYTNASSILLTWTAVDGAVRYDLEGIASGLTATGYRLELTPETHPDGTEIITRVRAYDKAGNVSGWSSAVSTIIDRTGPTTTIDGDPPPALTNNSMPTWKWKGDDGTGSGVAYYIVKLDDEPSFTTTDEMFTPSRGLEPGVHVLRVTAVDAIGNVGNELVFPDVTVVNPVVVRVTPLPGSYPINQVSTVVLGVTGVVDAELSVAIGSTDLADERIIEIARTVEMSKFYVLLDEEVLSPGELVLTVTAGATVEKFFYEVLNERSGFGFGRLRPW